MLTIHQIVTELWISKFIGHWPFKETSSFRALVAFTAATPIEDITVMAQYLELLNLLYIVARFGYHFCSCCISSQFLLLPCQVHVQDPCYATLISKLETMGDVLYIISYLFCSFASLELCMFFFVSLY